MWLKDLSSVPELRCSEITLHPIISLEPGFEDPFVIALSNFQGVCLPNPHRIHSGLAGSNLYYESRKWLETSCRAKGWTWALKVQFLLSRRAPDYGVDDVWVMTQYLEVSRRINRKVRLEIKETFSSSQHHHIFRTSAQHFKTTQSLHINHHFNPL